MKPPEMTAEDCRAILARLGLTRTGLARLMNLDKDTLARAERGEGRFAGTYRLLLATLDVAYSPDARAARDVSLCPDTCCADCDATKTRLRDSGYERAVNDLADFLAGAADGRSRPRGDS